MPIIKSAKKAARQSVKRRNKNQEIKKVIRNALKEFRNNPSAETMTKVQSEYDKAVKKGLLKKNTASRRKAKLAKFAKENNINHKNLWSWVNSRYYKTELEISSLSFV